MTATPPLPSAPPFANVIAVTTPYVPGYRIVRTLGVTWGLIVRSRGLGRNITAGFRSLAGGRSPSTLSSWTKLAMRRSNVCSSTLRRSAPTR